MRILLLMCSLFAFTSSSISFAKGYGMAGCGLGSLAIRENTPPMQIFAATLNNIISPQTSAITSGTSNCSESTELAVRLKQEDFVASNLTTLSKEMAQGEGETLRAFMGVLGCDGNSYGEFSAQSTKSYREIFKAPGAVAVLNSAKEEYNENPMLAKSCKYLI